MPSSTSYHLKDPKRGVMGPLGFDAIRDLLRAGAITVEAQVAREDEPFLELQKLEEFASLFERMSMRGSGSLRKMGFALLLFRLHRQGATGRLELTRDQERKIIYLEAGRPVFVSSNQPKERFGQYLLGQGLLDQHELRVALESMHVDQNRLMSTLLRLGLLDPNELANALRDQQVARLVDLCRWTDGAYEWIPDELHEHDRVPLGIDVTGLLVTAARAMSDQELHDRVKGRLERRLRVREPSALGALGLGPMEQRVIVHLSTGPKGTELLNELGVDDDRRMAVLRVLFLLAQTDNLAAN